MRIRIFTFLLNFSLQYTHNKLVLIFKKIIIKVLVLPFPSEFLFKNHFYLEKYPRYNYKYLDLSRKSFLSFF